MANRYDPGNPTNPANRYNTNNPFNPIKKEIKVSGAIFYRSYPNIIAQEIVDDLEAALEQFRLIANDLGSDTSEKVT